MLNKYGETDITSLKYDYLSLDYVLKAKLFLYKQSLNLFNILRMMMDKKLKLDDINNTLMGYRFSYVSVEWLNELKYLYKDYLERGNDLVFRLIVKILIQICCDKTPKSILRNLYKNVGEVPKDLMAEIFEHYVLNFEEVIEDTEIPSCHICCNILSEKITFLPCKHLTCTDCFDKLSAADDIVTCTFCRRDYSKVESVELSFNSTRKEKVLSF